ncbi:Ig-like domain-containing protein [Cyanobacterium aponinum UTEX 3222]|uniref:Ig-like domain-containing protein n=1 Tax=Cyanobacterium aponinum TaxID=379064 RepID=UPI002B4C1EC0|nr:Ig-like domain-containing protein [Cyanobacterium aponinum]WRL38467.1 Ig-like domain-containing protein [Cyanobacterium aponinum UTEX 3221]WRL42059.1 Ig-like domain-containing protein [Cyanobacterium aponinum UTEX 3222]
MLSNQTLIDTQFDLQDNFQTHWAPSSLSHSGLGWISSSQWDKDLNNSYAVIKPISKSYGGGGLTQIINNNNATQGKQILSFDAINRSQGETLRVQVFGVNGEFELSNWDAKNPNAINDKPMDFTTLLDTGNIANQEFNWKNFTFDLDLGSGYEYLAIRFLNENKKGVDESEFIGLDNVVLTQLQEIMPFTDAKFEVPELFQTHWAPSSLSHSDLGWISSSQWNKDLNNSYATINPITKDYGGGGLTQIIKNDHTTQGNQILSFDAINRSQGETLRVQVFGVNGDFQLSNWKNHNPKAVGNEPIEFSKLLDTGNIADQEFNWKNFTFDLDLGSGYEYIAVRFLNENLTGIDESEFIAIDNFMIANTLSNIPKNTHNQFPEANDDLVSTLKNNPIKIDVLSNDSDPEGDVFSLDSFTQPVNGSISLNQDGSFTYTPANNLTSQDNFTYTIVDEHGAKDTATVNITIKTPTMEIGSNLNGIADWSPQLPFIDGFNSSRNWIPQNHNIWDTKERDLLDLDENGWVKSLSTPGANFTKVGTLLFRDIKGQYQGGQYVVTYDGEGTIQYGFDAKLVSSTPGRDIIQVTPSNSGIYMGITATDPNKTGDYIRNISVVPIEKENTYQQDIFNPDFLNHIDDFKTLRFMDWMRTNGSQQSEWSDRPQLNDHTWSKEGGAPVEIMVELANRLDSDPWFTMPHMATDEYIRNFAQYAKDNLEPERQIYIEYSNEVWNWRFEQTHWVDQQAKAEGLDNWIDWYSKRTTEMTRIWDDVFGDDKERVIGVMGAQNGNNWTAQRALSYEWTDSPLSHQEYGIDVVAIAPYFGGYIGNSNNKDTLISWTKEADGGLSKLFDEINNGGLLSNSPSGGALAKSYQDMSSYLQLAKEQGLSLVAYEGGQHLVDKTATPEIIDLFAKANRDPRMGEIYKEYFQTWFNMGGGEFINFSDVGSYGKYGYWGLTEGLNQSSPKYEAVMDLINNSTN